MKQKPATLATFEARLAELRHAYALAARLLTQTASDKKRGQLHRRLDEIEAKLALYDGLITGYIDDEQTRARLLYLLDVTNRRIRRLHPRNYYIAEYYLARLNEIEAQLVTLEQHGQNVTNSATG